MLEEHRHLPDANRLSVLVAAILLAFALAQIVETQHYALTFDILGIQISLPLNLTFASTLFATGLTAAGMDWLLRGHPHFEQKNTLENLSRLHFLRKGPEDGVLANRQSVGHQDHLALHRPWV